MDRTRRNATESGRSGISRPAKGGSASWSEQREARDQSLASSLDCKLLAGSKDLEPIQKSHEQRVLCRDGPRALICVGEHAFTPPALAAVRAWPPRTVNRVPNGSIKRRPGRPGPYALLISLPVCPVVRMPDKCVRINKFEDGRCRSRRFECRRSQWASPILVNPAGWVSEGHSWSALGSWGSDLGGERRITAVGACRSGLARPSVGALAALPSTARPSRDVPRP